MTPFRGEERDAAALSGALSAANRDEEDVLRSIHIYETNMIRYGFRAVRESLKAMESTLDDRPFVRAVNRTAFKALEALPPIKNWVFGHVGDER
jgi:2-polyprenyl-6-methoxyphenol hydroxylase-like FAD-dependent oxidoreductase